jgi:iduronate 2-sulfatase
LYPTETRIMDNQTPPRTNIGDIVFLPQHFRQNGYFTARVGKVYHGGMDDPASWDISEEPRRTVRQRQRQQRRTETRQRKRAEAWEGDFILAGLGSTQVAELRWVMTENDDADEPDGMIARRAVQILEEHLRTRKDQPFFLAVGFHKPHLPWVAPRRYFEMHDPAKMPLPQTPPDDLEDIPKSL